MADARISDLTALSAAPDAADLAVLVDVSDATQAASGTTKKILISNLLLGVIVPCRHGMTLSNNLTDASNDIDVAAGKVHDTTLAGYITLGSAITKRLDAAWAVGTNQGGLDTGSEASATGYHVWAIKRPDTGVCDVLLSVNATSPTMPANYTLKQWIGWIYNDASSVIKPFKQYRNHFLWVTPVLDVDVTNPGTSRVTPTLTIPSGISTRVTILWRIFSSGVNVGQYFSCPDQADQSPSSTASPLMHTAATTAAAGRNQATVRSNVLSQIAYRLDASDAATSVRIVTSGWEADF